MASRLRPQRARSVATAVFAAAVGAASLGPGAPAGAEAFPGVNGLIAYSSEVAVTGGVGFDLFAVDPADSDAPIPLTDESTLGSDPAWSPDGTRIAFTSTSTSGRDIAILDRRDGSVRRLTDDPGDEYEPTWSPDGSQIAFASNRDNTDGTYDIHVIPTNSPNRQSTNLTKEPGADDDAPSWSPDGTQIVFVRERGGNPNLVVMSADGSAPSSITDNDSSNTGPSWSPDGRHIAFASVPANSSLQDILVMRADGSASPNNLTQSPTSRDYQPAWSPDGERIAFTSNRDGNPDIFTMAATDGSDVRGVANSQAAEFGAAWRRLIPPTEPQRVSAKPGEGSAAVSWVEPEYDGGDPVSGYSATASPGGAACTTAGGLTCTIAGLTPQTEYTVTVTAENKAGTGTASDPVLVTPTAPIAPGNPGGGGEPDVTRPGGGGEPSANPTTAPGPGDSLGPANRGTSLRVKAIGNKKLKAGKRYRLVKSVATNGQITKVRAKCLRGGEVVKRRAQKRVCGMKVKKTQTSARIVASPKCTSKVRITAVIRARATGADPAAFTRTWKVKQRPAVRCSR